MFWFKRKPKPTAGTGQRPASFKPQLEALERRDVPALIASQNVFKPPLLSAGEVNVLLAARRGGHGEQ